MPAALRAICLVTLSAIAPLAAQSRAPALARIHDLDPQEHREQGFVLDVPGEVQVEAMGGEARHDKHFNQDSRDPDYRTWPAAAWILNARTREVVWDLRTSAATRSRNGVRTFTGSVRLPAGVYEAHYASFPATLTMSGDGGGTINGVVVRLIRSARNQQVRYAGPYIEDGSYRDFGIAIYGAGHTAGADELAAARRRTDPSVVVALRGLDTSETRKVAFSLDRNTAFEIAATGEISFAPADYGWIIDADTHRIVWRMDSTNTEPAGGAAKNRTANTTLRLGPGRYVAYFTMDNSHGPGDWNAVPPFDPESWGMTLRIADASARAGFHTFDWQPAPKRETLASITRVGNNETRNQDFSLRRATDVRIYALGEGSGSNMADYGWLINLDTHERVWTMQQAGTTPAGGADKNREYNGTLHLEAGHYRVYYVTDDSHAFGSWNSTPPAEQEYWGVSIWPVSGRLDDVADPVATTPAARSLAALTHVGDNVNVSAPFHLDADGNVRVYAIGEGTGGDMDDYAWIEDASTGRTIWEMTYRMTEAAGGAKKNREFNGTIFLKAGKYRLRYKSDGSHSWGRWNDTAPDDPEGWGVTVTKAP